LARVYKLRNNKPLNFRVLRRPSALRGLALPDFNYLLKFKKVRKLKTDFCNVVSGCLILLMFAEYAKYIYICNMTILKIEYIKTAKLVPYAKNARTHSDNQVQQICKSILEFGFNNPVLIDEGNEIIAGHGRVMAAKDLGMEEVPCVRLSHLSDRQRRGYILADNKIALESGWDLDLLSAELDYLVESGLDVTLTAFNEEELDALLQGDHDKADAKMKKEKITVVAEHTRAAAAEEKQKVKSWAVLIEADNKSQARDILQDMAGKGFKCLIVENGDS
jgi:ParB family chromosome partitioning protein